MDQRAHVYSPLQNAAIWLASWSHGHVSADECLEALRDLGIDPRLDGVAPEAPAAGIELLRRVRHIAGDNLAAARPVVQLVLAGPGDAPGLRANSPAAQATLCSGVGALVFPTSDPAHNHIWVPDQRATGAVFIEFLEQEPLPAPPYLSPGDADHLLAEATRTAAELIDAQSATIPRRGLDSVRHPRLTVGTLADFYDTPGLPFHTPPRAAKLFARADQVSAIIETVSTHTTDRSLDPVLFPLMRHVRMARIAGVDYAVRELAR